MILVALILILDMILLPILVGANFEGTGCSFGISRLVYLILQLEQLEVDQKIPVIICTMNKKYFSYANEIAYTLRKNNINTEIYSDPNKNLGKQLAMESNIDADIVSPVPKIPEHFQNNYLIAYLLS